MTMLEDITAARRAVGSLYDVNIPVSEQRLAAFATALERLDALEVTAQALARVRDSRGCVELDQWAGMAWRALDHAVKGK